MARVPASAPVEEERSQGWRICEGGGGAEGPAVDPAMVATSGGEEEPGLQICEGGGEVEGPPVDPAMITAGGEEEPGRWIYEGRGGAEGSAVDRAMATVGGIVEERGMVDAASPLVGEKRRAA